MSVKLTQFKMTADGPVKINEYRTSAWYSTPEYYKDRVFLVIDSADEGDPPKLCLDPLRLEQESTTWTLLADRCYRIHEGYLFVAATGPHFVPHGLLPDLLFQAFAEHVQHALCDNRAQLYNIAVTDGVNGLLANLKQRLQFSNQPPAAKAAVDLEDENYCPDFDRR